MTSEEQRLTDYFNRFHTALLEYLKPHRNSIGGAFSGIATNQKTMMLYFCEDGFFARIANGWLDAPTIEIRDTAYEAATLLPVQLKTTELSSVDVGIAIRCKKELSSPEMFGYIDAQGREILYPKFLESAPIVKFFAVVNDTAVLHSLPVFMTSNTRELNESGEISPKEMFEIASGDFVPGFLFQWASNRADKLEGLDIDPRVEAYSLAQLILERCGIIKEPPHRKYWRAKTSLSQAINQENKTNEPAIHAAISEFPWVLVEEPDIDEFHSERTIEYSKQSTDAAGKQTTVPSRFRPDFIYKLHDGEFLIVEIEAASKKLMVQQQETGFQLFSAAANHALAQIRNYKTIITRYGNLDVCRELKCPSTTNFRFLLVVGSNDQPGFDRSSWEHAVHQLADQGIELRSWDYYLDKLERRRAAAAYDSSIFKP